MNRRAFLLLAATSPLAACQTARAPNPQLATDDEMAGWYVGTMDDQPFPVPLVDRSKMDAKFQRQTVAYTGSERPGTIVVDIDERFLYHVQAGGTATRYGIGVGKQGFSWRGTAHVGRKAVWPDWSPTATMVSLNRGLPRHRKGGLDNPLGARALYLYQGNRDILFRIHGTNEPWSIGEAVSSGCIRMLNEDVVDLYAKVPTGTTVLVRKNGRWRV